MVRRGKGSLPLWCSQMFWISRSEISWFSGKFYESSGIYSNFHFVGLFLSSIVVLGWYFKWGNYCISSKELHYTLIVYWAYFGALVIWLFISICIFPFYLYYCFHYFSFWSLLMMFDFCVNSKQEDTYLWEDDDER